MAMLPKREWAEMTWEDFTASDTARWIAVLPLAATEQHGPHLPLAVDSFIAEAYLGRVRALVPADLPVSFLPVQTIGQSDEHRAFPGTLTLSGPTVIRAWTEIGESVARAGVKKLVLATSHGGNVAAMEMGAAGAPRHAGGDRGLASLRLSGRRIRRRRAPAWHPWRRHRDLADPGPQGRNGAHGQSGAGHAGHGRDGTGIQMARGLPPRRVRLGDPGPPRLGRGRGCPPGDRPKGRGRAGAWGEELRGIAERSGPLRSGAAEGRPAAVVTPSPLGSGKAGGNTRCVAANV